MATISLATYTGATHQSRNHNTRIPYIIGQEVDFEAAVTSKGSALASSDVIEAVNIPADSLVLAAGMKVTEVHAGTSTDTAFDLGFTGGNVDNFVDGFDFDGASLGDTAWLNTQTGVLVSTADTLDILIQAMTGTTTGGKIWVWALVVDVAEANRPGLAALGS